MKNFLLICLAISIFSFNIASAQGIPAQDPTFEARKSRLSHLIAFDFYQRVNSPFVNCWDVQMEEAECLSALNKLFESAVGALRKNKVVSQLFVTTGQTRIEPDVNDQYTLFLNHRLSPNGMARAYNLLVNGISEPTMEH